MSACLLRRFSSRSLADLHDDLRLSSELRDSIWNSGMIFAEYYSINGIDRLECSLTSHQLGSSLFELFGKETSPVAIDSVNKTKQLSLRLAVWSPAFSRWHLHQLAGPKINAIAMSSKVVNCMCEPSIVHGSKRINDFKSSRHSRATSKCINMSKETLLNVET